MASAAVVVHLTMEDVRNALRAAANGSDEGRVELDPDHKEAVVIRKTLDKPAIGAALVSFARKAVKIEAAACPSPQWKWTKLEAGCNAGQVCGAEVSFEQKKL